MSQDERHAKQRNAMAAQAAEHLRQQQALRPKPLAVYVAAAFGYMLPTWRTLDYSVGAAEAYRRAHPIAVPAFPDVPLFKFGEDTIHLMRLP